MIEALGRMRFLTTGQIATLFFGGSRSAANKRLRHLLDAGLVRVWLRNLNTDNVYTITPLGRRELERISDDQELAAAIQCPRDLDRQLDHLLAINSVRVTLAMQLPDAGGTIIWWRSDWELRTSSAQRIIPDAMFALRWPDLDERIFALEVEHHTRAPRRFVAKLLRYSAASYRRGGMNGETNPTVLVVGHSMTWLAHYRATIEPLALSVKVWFASFQDLDRLVGQVWQAPTGSEQYSLRTLATLPNGKEGCAADSLGKSRFCAARAAHTSSPYAPDETPVRTDMHTASD